MILRRGKRYVGKAFFDRAAIEIACHDHSMLWGAVWKKIISDRFSTKTAISGGDSYLCMQRYYLWQR